MGWAAAAAIGIQAAGSLAGSSAQSGATKQGIKEQRRQFDTIREDQRPYREAGDDAIGQLRFLTSPGQDLARYFGAADFQEDPGYQFRLNEGQKALENTASARSGLLTGEALKASIRYNQGAAADEYSSAYSRFNNDRNQRFQRLATIANGGQAAASQTAAAGINAANNISELNTQQGNAQAAGYAGLAQAIGSGISQYSNNRPVQGVGTPGGGWVSGGQGAPGGGSPTLPYGSGSSPASAFGGAR